MEVKLLDGERTYFILHQIIWAFHLLFTLTFGAGSIY